LTNSNLRIGHGIQTHTYTHNRTNMTKEDILTKLDRNSVQVIILPIQDSHTSSFSKVTIEGKEYLVSSPEQTLLALNKTNFKDSYDAKQKLTKASEPLNSILISSGIGVTQNEPCLIVGEKPEIYVGTPFNVIYFLLSCCVDILKREKQRMLPYDDLLEKLEDSESIRELIKLKIPFEDSLKLICETVKENDETFYKVSIEKITKFLTDRVERIVGNFPETLNLHIQRHLGASMQQDQLLLTKEVARLSKVKTAINLLSSYVDSFYLDVLRKSYNFNDLDEYLKQYRKVEESNRIAEENLRALNQKITSASKSKKRKHPAKKLKPVKKVEIGRGALDMFFKRK